MTKWDIHKFQFIANLHKADNIDKFIFERYRVRVHQTWRQTYAD